MSVLVLVLIVAAAVLAAVNLIQSEGRDLLGWAVLAIAVALLIPQVA